MKVASWIWTGFSFMILALFIWFLAGYKNYTGSNIILTTDDKRQFTINAESVTIEAASGKFFALRSLGGETIVGTPTQKPLGWDENEYYSAEPSQVQGGTWLVEHGRAITIHLTSSDNITVQSALKRDQKVMNGLVLGLLFFIAWVFGLFVIGKK